MERMVITGGRQLAGRVEASGAKNAVLPLMAATLLADGPHRIRNVPDLADVRTMRRLLTHLGAEISGDGEITAAAAGAEGCEAPYELVKTMRASCLVLGPLAARRGRARVSLPGGCAIGARPIDFHLAGLSAMGAEVALDHGYVEVRVPGGRLRGAEYTFPGASVTGTENLMMAATLARGTTVLAHAAREPEVVDLARALNAAGARIRGAGGEVIRIEGVEALGPLDHEVIPDRVEAATMLLAGAMAGGEVTVAACLPSHLTALTAKLGLAGVDLALGDGEITVQGRARPRAVDLETAPYPGFPTDVQAQFMACMCRCQGLATISEAIFENRFMHVQELARMGARIEVSGPVAAVRGVERLEGADVMATDLRASASLVLAGLVAEGVTRVARIYHLDRGYVRLDEKLASLGAEVHREPAPWP